MDFKNTLEYALEADQQDPLQNFREEFYIPPMHGKESIYFTGNSLGLQPKNVRQAVLDELEDWANLGVEGHEHARNPWISYHEIFPEKLSPIVGGLPEEIVVMNQLTTNIHILLASFYRPRGKRKKIIFESKAFPSDEYALVSQIKLAGLQPEETLIELLPRKGEHTLRHEDILQAIQDCGEELALVFMGGVNYYSGQVFDMKAITEAAHRVGAYCGFDLAHGAGNIKLELHDWEVDFACWCTYKYLNSGPGSVGGAFIHQRHVTNPDIPRLAGWWGTNKTTRFKMEKQFDPIPTAEGWQLSNAPILSMAAHKAALEIFEQAGFEQILEKGKRLSAYLFFILNEINGAHGGNAFEIITPQTENEHGCQASLLMKENGKKVFETLEKNSVIVDWRKPNVIRLAPVPLYNSFEDVYSFGKILKEALQ